MVLFSVVQREWFVSDKKSEASVVLAFCITQSVPTLFVYKAKFQHY